MSSAWPPGRPQEHLQAVLPRLVEVLAEPEASSPPPVHPPVFVGTDPVKARLPVLSDVVQDASAKQQPEVASLISEVQIQELTAALEPTWLSAVEGLAWQLARQRAEGLTRAMMQSLNMLTCTEGQERTAAEYDALCRAAGFSRTEAVVTGAPVDAVLALK